MMDIANLGFRIDTGDVTRARSEVNALSGAAKSLAGVLGAAFTFQKTVQSITAFEDSMLKLRATSRATEADMAKLEKQARSLGATTRYSAKQAADAQNFLAMAGFSTGEILQSTGDVIKFASAASIDLAQSADIASNVLGQMGLGVGSLSTVMDTLINTTQSSNTNVTQLAEALGYVGPIAASSGVSIHELSAAIGVLGDAGIQGGRAGTGLTGVIASLSKQTPAATAALLKYGIEAKDVDIATVGLTDAMELLGKANISASDAITIFGRESASAALNIANGSDRIRELTEANIAAAGTTQEVASILDSGLSAALASVTSALEEAMLQTGDAGLTGAMKVLAVTVAGVISSFNGLLPEFAEANGLSENFTRNIELLSTAIELAALAFGAKLVGSLITTAATLGLVGIRAVSTQLALANMGGIATGTALRLLAVDAAAKGLSAGLALLGGPAGAIMLAVGALFYFSGGADKAKQKSAELNNQLVSLGGTFDTLSKKQAAAMLLDYQKQLQESKTKMLNLGQAMAQVYQQMNDAPEYMAKDEWLEQLTRLRAEQERLGLDISQTEKHINDLKAAADRNPLSKLTGETASASEAFETMRVAILEQTLALQHNTAEALFNARVKAGLVGELAEGEQVVLSAMYKNLDAQKALSDARKVTHKGVDRSIKAYDDKVKAIDDAIRALQLEASTLGMTTEQIKVNELALLGATGAQMKLAEAASETIRVYHQQIAAMQRMSDINVEAVSIIGSLMTEEEAIASSYEKRRAIILEATDITEQQRTATMIRLEEERAQALSQIDADYWDSKYMSELERESLELEKLDRDMELINETYALKLELLEEQRAAEHGMNAHWNEQEAALKQQHEDRIAQIERARRDMQLNATSKMFGDMSSATKAFFGENSKIHKAALMAEKAFAIARVLINAPASFSGAYAAVVGIPVVGPTLAPIAGAAAVAAQLAQAASIGSVNVSGMAHDGIDSVPQTGTWLLEKGERVTTSETSAKLDATLDQIRNQGGGGGATVNVNLYEDASKAGTVEQQDNEDGTTDINVFVSDIMSGGDRAQALESAYGLQRQGS